MHEHFDRSATGNTDCRVDWRLSYKCFVISVIFMADRKFSVYRLKGACFHCVLPSLVCSNMDLKIAWMYSTVCLFVCLSVCPPNCFFVFYWGAWFLCTVNPSHTCILVPSETCSILFNDILLYIIFLFLSQKLPTCFWKSFQNSQRMMASMCNPNLQLHNHVF